MTRHSQRPGLTRADVLVLIVMAFVSTGLTGCISKAREAASRIDCINNLKQIGLACHVYSDSSGRKDKSGKPEPGPLPTEAQGVSVFYTLLPFIEQASLHESMQKGGAVQDVRIYLCPSRRRPPTGGKGDYGYGSTTGGIGQSVLDAPKALTLGEITTKDGTSNTLLLAHKGMNTDHYSGGGKNDTGWNTLDHARDPGQIYQDCKSSDRDLSTLIGSAHPTVCPAVWCDGHAQNIPYHTTTMPQFWAYNDGATVSPP